MIAVWRGKGQVKEADNRDRTLAKIARMRHPKFHFRSRGRPNFKIIQTVAHPPRIIDQVACHIIIASSESGRAGALRGRIRRTEEKMAKITECVIDVDLANAIRKMADALDLKVPDGKLGFRCPECRQPVKSMVSGKTAAHFEHLNRNKDCSLSHVRRPNGR